MLWSFFFGFVYSVSFRSSLALLGWSSGLLRVDVWLSICGPQDLCCLFERFQDCFKGGSVTGSLLCKAMAGGAAGGRKIRGDNDKKKREKAGKLELRSMWQRCNRRVTSWPVWLIGSLTTDQLKPLRSPLWQKGPVDQGDQMNCLPLWILWRLL